MAGHARRQRRRYLPQHVRKPLGGNVRRPIPRKHTHLARSRTAFLAPPRRCVRASHVPPLHRYDYHITTTHPHFGMHAGQAYWFGDGLIHSHPGTSWQWFHHTEGLGATLGAFLEQTGVRAAPPLMPPPPPSQPRCVTRRVPSSPYTSSPSAPPRSHSAAPMLSHSSGGQVALYDGADSRCKYTRSKYGRS